MRKGHFASKIGKKKSPRGGYFRRLLHRDPITLIEGELEQHVRLIGKNKGTIEILQGNSPIASLYFQFGRNLKQRLPEIKENDLYVDLGDLPAVRTGGAYQNQGLASQMLTELLGFAKEKGSKAVYLRVNHANQKAFRLYKKFGFEEVRQVSGKDNGKSPRFNRGYFGKGKSFLMVHHIK